MPCILHFPMTRTLISWMIVGPESWFIAEYYLFHWISVHPKSYLVQAIFLLRWIFVKMVFSCSVASQTVFQESSPLVCLKNLLYITFLPDLKKFWLVRVRFDRVILRKTRSSRCVEFLSRSERTSLKIYLLFSIFLLCEQLCL